MKRTTLLAKLRLADLRFYEERDRRYAEVSLEREKALKIKEAADDRALQLAREIQTYKDEKANELREQISRERGHYVSKEELSAAVRELNATIEPLKLGSSSMAGRGVAVREVVGWVFAAIGAVALIVTAVYQIHSTPAVQPTVQYVPAPTAMPTPAPVTVPR